MDLSKIAELKLQALEREY